MNFIWDNLFRDAGERKGLRESLRQNILFQDLNPLELRLLQRIVNVRTYRAGEPIFKQGETGVGMYIILSGSVDIITQEIEITTGKSNVNPVILLKPKDFFGELALVEREGRRSASAFAHEDSVLVGFFKPDLIEIIDRNPTAGVKILMRLAEVLGTRLHQTTAKISELKREKLNEKEL